MIWESQILFIYSMGNVVLCFPICIFFCPILAPTLIGTNNWKKFVVICVVRGNIFLFVSLWLSFFLLSVLLLVYPFSSFVTQNEKKNPRYQHPKTSMTKTDPERELFRLDDLNGDVRREAKKRKYRRQIPKHVTRRNTPCMCFLFVFVAFHFFQSR